jgi:CHAT domain-containing protein/tetratricopeptide (TPR) repeat protein
MIEEGSSRIWDLLFAAEAQRVKGLLDEAEALVELALSTSEQSAPTNAELCFAFNLLAHIKERQGQFTAAIDLFGRSLNLLQNQPWATHQMMAVLLINLGECFQKAGQLDNAEAALSDSLRIAQHITNGNNVEMANALGGMASILRDKGDYGSAIMLYERALSVLRDQLGPEHVDVAVMSGRAANLYLDAGNLDRAYLLYSDTDAILQKIDAPPLLRADMLAGWAGLCSRQGRHREAETIRIEEVELRKTNLGVEHPSYLLTLRDLAGALSDQGRYAKSEAIYRDSLAGLERTLGPNHIDVARVQNDLAMVLSEQGLYIEAGYLYSTALNTMSEQLGESHPELAAVLNNLAGLRCDQILYPEAERLYRRSLNIQIHAWGSQHENVARCQNNLANAIRGQARFAEAESLHHEAINTLRQMFGADHPSVGIALHNLAVTKLLQGCMETAKTVSLEAADILERNLGSDAADLAPVWDTLATIAEYERCYAEAEDRYRRALSIAEIQWGPENPGVAWILKSLAKLFARTGRPSEAFQFLRRAINIEHRVVGETLAASTEEQRLQYRKFGQNSIDDLLSLVCQFLPNSPEAIRFVFDLVLARKGMVSETFVVQREALTDKDERIQADFERLTTLRQSVSKLALSLARSERPSGDPQQLLGQLYEKQELETRLAKILGNNVAASLRRANTDALAAALPEGWDLVEFVRYEENDFSAPKDARGLPTQSTAYAVFFLKGRSPETIALINIANARKIDGLVVKFRSLLANAESNPDAIYAISQTLGLALFESLLPQLTGCRQFFIAPDGELNLLPFEVLSVSTTGEFLADRYDIAYLSAGRDILRFSVAPQEAATSPVVIASPDFNLGSKSGAPPELIFDSLDGALHEGERIAQLLDVPLISGSGATKSALPKRSSPSILVLSTHAYFLPDDFFDVPRHSSKEGHATVLGDLNSRGLPNPMWRSGLAFAGANTFLAGQNLPDEIGTGIITAEEISTLNLSCNELTVLAACGTGLGAVQAGEGVFGFRRALGMSGSRAVLLSLWKVDDAATSFLIERFFWYLLFSGKGRLESLHRARTDLRNLTISEVVKLPYWKGTNGFEFGHAPDYRPFAHPYYWAAFILQGDPRPLPNEKLLD